MSCNLSFLIVDIGFELWWTHEICLVRVSLILISISVILIRVSVILIRVSVIKEINLIYI